MNYYIYLCSRKSYPYFSMKQILSLFFVLAMTTAADAKTVTVTYDANKTDVQKLLAAFERIGKPATVKSSSVPQQTPPVDANTDATTSATQQSE